MAGTTTRPEVWSGEAAAWRVDRLPVGLLTLWLATAAGLTLAPFLTSFSMTFGADGDDPYTISADGWGQVEGPSSYGQNIRIGVLCVVIAAALLVALVAALVQRIAAWPLQLGLSAAAMTVATGVFQLLRSDAVLSAGIDEDIDPSIGGGAWLITGMAGLAVVAIVLTMVRMGRLRS